MNGLEVTAAAFQAKAETEIAQLKEQVKALWQQNAKRAAEVEAVRSQISSGIKWFALAAGGVLWGVVRPKLGL